MGALWKNWFVQEQSGYAAKEADLKLHVGNAVTLGAPEIEVLGDVTWEWGQYIRVRGGIGPRAASGGPGGEILVVVVGMRLPKDRHGRYKSNMLSFLNFMLSYLQHRYTSSSSFLVDLLMCCTVRGISGTNADTCLCSVLNLCIGCCQDFS